MLAVLQLQVALVLGWLALCGLDRAVAGARARLWADRAVLLLALAAPLLAAVLPRPWRPPAALRGSVVHGAPVAQLQLDALGLATTPVALPLDPVAPALDLLAGVPLLLVGAGLLRLVLAVGRLARSLADAREDGVFEGVPVLVHPAVPGPFAALLPRGRVIVLDPATAAGPDRGLALRHERQHHRQGDPLVAWLWLFLRGALGWNPVLGAWAAAMSDREEQAVDAAVVARPEVSPRAYGALLLAHATRPAAPAGATGLPARGPLHRRLLALARPAPTRWPQAAAAGLLAGALVLGGTLGTASLAADLRLDRAAIDRAVARSPHAELVDHPLVRRELRRMVGDNAAFYRRALGRRAAHAPLVDGALAQAGLPALLAAVPLVESGYSNWGAPGDGESRSAAPGRIPGRGLWMFIAPTARAYGLQVDGDRDQRLDPDAETAAAVALLTELHAEFGDWALALAAYNQGSAAVHAAIAAGGSRDAFVLMEAGLLNAYAAQVMAGALLLASPALTG